MKFIKFKQKLGEVIEDLHPPNNFSVEISRNENGDFRADCSDGTVVIGGYNTSDFKVFYNRAIAS